MLENDMEKTQLTDTGATQTMPGVGTEATQQALGVTCPVCHTTNAPGETYCCDCGFLLASAREGFEIAAEQPGVAAELVPKLVEPSTGREFALNPGPNTIGRENADVLLTHPSVSRKHATLTVADGKYLLEDVGSTNGTFAGGKKIEPGEQAEVEPGTELMFGSAVLKLEAPPEDAAVSAAEAVREVEEAEEREKLSEESVAVEEAAEEPSPPVEVEPEQHEAADQAEAAEIPVEPGVEARFEATPEQTLEPPVEAVEVHEELPTLARLVAKPDGQEHQIRPGENTIGRRPANSVVIPDLYVSGSHAVINASDAGFTITDVGSTNGTFVNGERLTPNEPRELQDGDELTLGQSVFRFTI